LGTLNSPNVQLVLDVKGTVQVAGDAYLKVALAFGIDILKGTWKVQAALVDKPGSSISARVSGSATIANGEVTHHIGMLRVRE
jgi:carbon monoxide dehydrogenase subunit G